MLMLKYFPRKEMTDYTQRSTKLYCFFLSTYYKGNFLDKPLKKTQNKSYAL